jgi:predicted membrane protein
MASPWLAASASREDARHLFLRGGASIVSTFVCLPFLFLFFSFFFLKILQEYKRKKDREKVVNAKKRKGPRNGQGQTS